VISATATSYDPLEPRDRASAIASLQNSLESDFDPSQLVLSPHAWPQPPTSIPIRLPRRSFSVGYHLELLEESQFDVDVHFPRTKPATGMHWHVRSCTANFFDKLPGCGSENRQAIYVTVVRELTR